MISSFLILTVRLPRLKEVRVSVIVHVDCFPVLVLLFVPVLMLVAGAGVGALLVETVVKESYHNAIASI